MFQRLQVCLYFISSMCVITQLSIFILKKEAKEVLFDPSKRKDYDKWKTSGIMISYKQWLSMRASNCVSDISQVTLILFSRKCSCFILQAFHWASPRSEGKMLPYETNNLQQAPTTAASQHSPSYAMRPHLTYNSILAKFRNYEI